MEHINELFSFFQGDVAGKADKFFHQWVLQLLLWSVQISAQYFWLGIGFGGLLLVANKNHENESKNQTGKWILPVLLILISGLPAIAFWLIPKLSVLAKYPHQQPDFYLKWWMYSAGAGSVFAFLWLRFGVKCSRLRERK